jgi:hypothetical protein
MKSNVTLVTAFYDLEEDRSKDKSNQRYWGLFEHLCQTGLPICLFLSKTFAKEAEAILTKYKNVKLMSDSLTIQDTLTSKLIRESNGIQLPENRTVHHDTKNFMVMMNSKPDFVAQVATTNPFDTSHFAWIDFGICHVLKDIPATLGWLKLICCSKIKSKMLLFPACWTKSFSLSRIEHVHSGINWRFCGGFYIGDMASVLCFSDSCNKALSTWVNEKRRLTWEVNMWAWMESIPEFDFEPDSYMADHNDTILKVPVEYLEVVCSMTTIPPRILSCQKTIESLIYQVDHLYLNVCPIYDRFGKMDVLSFQELLKKEPFKSKMTINVGPDFGPATKYLGSLKTIDPSSWVFYADDDQQYHPKLISTMKNSLQRFGVYQNRHELLKQTISGSFGHLVHMSSLEKIETFPLPEGSLFVDSWLSIYCSIYKVSVFPSKVEAYESILSKLHKGHELIGVHPLSAVEDKEKKLQLLGNYFKINLLTK